MDDGWKVDMLKVAINAAREACAMYDDCPSALLPVTVAQFIVESGWGLHNMGVYNYFGIKARPDEPGIDMMTKEFVHGHVINVPQRFKKYDSMAESFADHVDLIMHRRFQSGELIYKEALDNPDDPVAFANALTGVYATDPDYGKKLVDAMTENGLLDL